jgi:preprotein translocase subunit YajC
MPSTQLVYPYLTGTNIPGSGFNTTCTVTNGSATVTGQFTIWETALDKGDVLFVAGMMGLVQEIVSDTEITLAMPWAGESSAPAPYAAYRNNSYVDPRNYGRRLAEYLSKLKPLPANIDDMMEIVTEAVAARDKAEEWATKTDAEVEPGEGYGAKKYAQDAAGSATTATDAATTATTKAGTATTAAGEATGAWDSFRAVYYGALASDPSTDPLGNPPNDGDIYYNTTTGGLRLRKGGLWGAAVLDANGALVAVNNLSDLPDKAVARGNLGLPTSGPMAGFRNLIINGLGTINQRGYVSGAATTAANQYTLDRWRVVASGQGLSWTTAGGYATITAPAGGVEQVIEGANILGGVYTLSWQGTATATVNGVAVENGGEVTLTGGINATVRFLGGTFSLPQFEPGGTATPFEMRPIGVEIGLCQRYFVASHNGTRTSDAAQAPTMVGVSATLLSSFIPFPCLMRAIPTLTIINPTNGSLSQVRWNGVNIGISSVQFGQKAITNMATTSSGTMGTGAYFHYEASAEL